MLNPKEPIEKRLAEIQTRLKAIDLEQEKLEAEKTKLELEEIYYKSCQSLLPPALVRAQLSSPRFLPVIHDIPSAAYFLCKEPEEGIFEKYSGEWFRAYHNPK